MAVPREKPWKAKVRSFLLAGTDPVSKSYWPKESSPRHEIRIDKLKEALIVIIDALLLRKLVIPVYENTWRSALFSPEELQMREVKDFVNALYDKVVVPQIRQAITEKEFAYKDRCDELWKKLFPID